MIAAQDPKAAAKFSLGKEAASDAVPPPVREINEWLWWHFQRLRAFRPPTGFGGAGPIPVSAIVDWARAWGIRDGYRLRLLLSVVSTLDLHDRGMMSDAAQQEAEKTKRAAKHTATPSRGRRSRR